MDKHVLEVHVGWTGDNFCGGWYDDELGTVLVTGKSVEAVKDEFAEALRFHIEGCVADGDRVPEFLEKGEYELDYQLDAAALLRNAEQYTSLAAISRASGINQKQLSHYANGVKKPRAAQREKIIDGLHRIGRQMLALM